MSFLAPLFLLGALAVSLPVIFHLIRRTTRERTPFSSLMLDRKSTRLNSSHQITSYAVFCLKKKKHLTDLCLYFFFISTAISDIYTLSLHDALPICQGGEVH